MKIFITGKQILIEYQIKIANPNAKKWKKKDPIQKYQNKLLRNNEITEEEINKIEKNLLKKINQAYKYAESSPYPKPSEAFNYIYAK